MRIIAGKYARRQLMAPAGQGTRPTSDRAREAIFNILQHQDWGGRAVITGARVLDVCCGTGAMGLEALSRGAGSLWLMEQDKAALQATQLNIAALGVQAQCHILRGDARHPPQAPHGCDLIFIDPPYRQNLPEQIVPALQSQGWITPDALLVIETGALETVKLNDKIPLLMQRRYGAAMVSFFRMI